MEAVGSRLGRASSRYGAPSVFSGPVRKWKKKWVHVSPSSISRSSSSSHSHHSHNNTTANHNSRLLLCRWTPTSAAAADDDADNSSDEPPRRKFRYTPIAVLEEQKRLAVRKAESEVTTEIGQSTARPTNVTNEIHGKLNMNEVSEEETQESNMNQLELGLGFKGDNGDKSQNAAVIRDP